MLVCLEWINMRTDNYLSQDLDLGQTERQVSNYFA